MPMPLAQVGMPAMQPQMPPLQQMQPMHQQQLAMMAAKGQRHGYDARPADGESANDATAAAADDGPGSHDAARHGLRVPADKFRHPCKAWEIPSHWPENYGSATLER
jgi:hypothetical protein